MGNYRLPDNTVPVLLSSDSADGVRAEAAAILAYLHDNPHTTPERLAGQLFRTRIARRYRALIMATERADLLDALRAVCTDSAHPALVTSDGPAAPRRIGFVFPGQGSQHAGMGKLYYELSPAYRAAVDDCAALHRDRFGDDRALRYLLGTVAAPAGSLPEVQPARMFHLIGLAAMWRSVGVDPVVTVGHSQGELAACAVAGALETRDAVLIVAHRAELLEQRLPQEYAVAVFGTGRADCEELLARHSGWAEVSVVNAPRLVGVSGERQTIADLVQFATAKGIFARQLQLSFPAHTSMITGLRTEFQQLLEDEFADSTFLPSEIACYGATLGAVVTQDLTHREYWYWNMRNRVRFDRAIMAAAETVDTFVEIAEHPTLQPAIRENLSARSPSSRSSARDFLVVGTSQRTAVGLAEFTRNVAEIAVNDAHYPWQSLRSGADERVPSLPLRDFPATVMSTKRLWAPYQSEPQAATVVTAAAAPVRLHEQWTTLAQRSLTAPRTVLLIDHDERDGDLAALLHARAPRFGAEISSSAEIFSSAQQFDTVMLLLPTVGATDEAGAVAELAAFASAAARLTTLAPGVTECWLVTTGAEAVTPDDLPALGHAAISAAFRCLGLDHLGVAFRHLDLPGEVGDQDPQAVADKIIQAVHVGDEPEVAIRHGKLHAKRLVVAERSTAPAPPPRDVLILGGTGHVGREFCARFVRDGADRITLVSRTGETPALTERLRQIRALGPAEIEVVACDITDSAAVAGLARRYAQRPASVVVHAAVDYVWSQLDPAAVGRATAAKVLGVGEVLRAVPLADDCTVLLCSSFAASLGGRGQALYAGTNRMLDGLAVRLRAQGLDCVAVQWGLWGLSAQEHGEAETRVLGAGLRTMDAAAAITAGFTGRSANSVVLSAQWDRLRETIEIAGLASVFAPALTALAPAVPRPVLAEPAQATVESVRAADVPVDYAQIIRREVARVMLTDGRDEIDSSVPLVALGFDSLQALDLHARLASTLDRDVPVTRILAGASLDDVVLLVSENRS
ncbi:nocobactin polyketide synthase NbtC [Nocardia sp. XZ_19_369]|uniref:nocobactin polyketide synthase NbtC n=1 Tax=Nocardia sp. XZ_19_369 TaxID=2769487 RepID=UPI0018904341|nr:nocobactin polyketide synthase NbtC [Nocardia sp. XZ_19_369]